MSTLTVCNGQEPFAFISYNHQDKKDVFPILKLLQKWKLPYWFDGGLNLGEDWAEAVALKLLECKVAIIMLSSNALRSSNVRREVNLALDEGKTLIVVNLDNTALTPGMKLQFGMFHMISKKEYDSFIFERILIESLRKWIG